MWLVIKAAVILFLLIFCVMFVHMDAVLLGAAVLSDYVKSHDE